MPSTNAAPLTQTNRAAIKQRCACVRACMYVLHDAARPPLLDRTARQGSLRDCLLIVCDLLGNQQPTVPCCAVSCCDVLCCAVQGSRHPCVEVQEGVSFVANDCVLNRGNSWFSIITGPNMGGKSTFIRQVGRDGDQTGELRCV